MMNTTEGGGINSFNHDIMNKIFVKLPAKSFGLAACVNKTWNRIATLILSTPKLATALSTNSSLLEAVEEVLDKVLSKPIRPHFAIACISEEFALGMAHTLLLQRLGSKTPLVTHISNGVMGKDVLSDEMKEVQWEYFDYCRPHPRESEYFYNSNQAIVLVVGYLPGLKVDAIPLFHPKTDYESALDYKEFLRQIKEYTAGVSNSEFPDAIMMFGDLKYDLSFVASRLDEMMPKETAIVGDAGGCFLFNSLNYAITSPLKSYVLDAVALVFAKDKNKPIGVGETQFHVMMAGGLVPFGPKLEVTSVGLELSKRQSWFRAIMEGQNAPSTMSSVLQILDDEQETEESKNLYVAVNRERRNITRGGRFWRLDTSTSFYHILRSDGTRFFVDGVGIRAADSIYFYHRNLETANNNNNIALETLKMLKSKTSNKKDKNDPNNNKDEDVVSTVNHKTVFGGLIFSCKTRGASYFGVPNSETNSFSLNFPEVPIAGVFCKGEIGRGSSKLIEELGHYVDQSPPNCCIHSCSAVYLVMSYVPPNISQG